MLTSTTFEIFGYRVVSHLGVVRGITVRSRNVFGTIGASLQTLLGGNISLYTGLAERARNEVFNLMVEHGNERARTRSSESATTRPISPVELPKCSRTAPLWWWSAIEVEFAERGFGQRVRTPPKECSSIG